MYFGTEYVSSLFPVRHSPLTLGARDLMGDSIGNDLSTRIFTHS